MDLKSTFYALFIALIISSSLQAERSSKTDKYLSILIKRPSSDYLFDKFYSSWLENATGADLESFLDEKFTETQNPIYQQIKAYYLEAEGSNHDALDIYNEIISTQSSASLLFRRAKLQMGTLEFEKAIADLKAASALSDKEKLTIQINKLLGKIYIRDEKKELGLKVWLAMAETNDDEDLLEEIIELMIDEGLFAEARGQIEKLLKQSKDKHKQVTLTLRLGDIYRTQGNKNEALKKYAETLDKIGTGSWLEKEVLSQIEQVFRSEDNLHGLAEYLDKISKDKSNNIEILKRQATLLFELGEKEKSLKAYQQIVKLTPLSKENKEIYAQQLSRSNKFQEALELTQALIKQYPDDKELYITQAKLYHELKNQKLCSSSLFTYIKKDKESEYAYIRAANLLRNFELKDEAKKIYLALIAKYPESREGKMLNALNLYELGEKDLALEEYQKLGETDQIAEIQRLISTLNTLKEQETAFSILEAQQENFINSFKYNEILLSSANSLKKTEMADKAAALMLKSASTSTDIRKACNNIIFASKKVNKLDEVQEKLENIESPTKKEIILLSNIYDQMGEIDTAFEIIENEISKAPNSELFLEQKLHLSKKNREWEQAILTLSQISKLSSKHKAMRIKDLVELSLKADQTEEALKWIATWKKISVSSTTPHIQEASIYRNKMDFEKSTEVLKKAMFKFPDNKTLPNLLAQDLRASGKIKEAKSVYWRMANKSEELAEKLAHIRSIIQLSQNDDSTHELAQKLQARLENNPKSIFPPLALAELNRHSGFYEDRRKFLLKATEIKPNDIGLLKEIARIEEEEGQYDRALETLRKIKSLDKTKSNQSLLVQFYMRNGEEDRAFEQIVENSGGKDMSVDDIIKTTISLIKIRSEKTPTFIKPYLLQHPDDYRLAFLYAIALEEQDLTKETAFAYINVLNASKEVTPTKKASNNTPNPYMQTYSNYYKELAEFLPQEAIELIKNSNSIHNAYSYKQNHGRSYRMTAFGNQQQFPMPQKLEEIETYILPHLSTIYLALNEEEQAEISQKLDSMGIKYPKLKLTLFNQRNRQRNQLELWQKFADSYIGDKTFDALYAYMISIQIRTLEDFNKYFEVVKKHKPMLAVNMVITASHRKVKVESKYIDFAINTMLERDHTKLNSGRLAQLLLIEDMKPENIAKIKALMLKTYLQEEAKQNSWGPHQLVRSLVKLKDYSSLVMVINHELDNSNKKITNLYNNYNFGYSYGGRRQQKIIAPIKFPPENSKLVPNFIAQMFNAQNYYLRETPIDKELLVKELEKIKSPIIRLFIADYCEDEALAQKIISSLQNEKQSSLDTQVFISAWFGKNEKFKEVVSTLMKARKLCAKKSERKLINAALVYYIELSEDESLKAEGKLAGERLIALRLSLQEKGELASSLENLGFTSLANTLDKEIDKASSRSVNSNVSSGFSSSRRNVDPTQKVRELIKKNEPDKALELAVREFRKLAKNELNFNSQQMGNSSWQLKNLMRLILEKRLSEKFITLLSPKQSDAFSRALLERALAHELLKQADKAIADYQAVLAKNADSKAANLRLAFLIAEKDPKLAKELLLKATGKNINFIGPVISSIISSMHNKASVYDIYPLIADILKDSKVGMNQDHYWINNILSQMENSVHTNEFQLPHIFDQSQTIERSKNKAKAKAVLLKREKSYIELCKIALKFPSTSAYAFGRLEYLISQDRLKSENSFLLAKQSLKTASDSQYYQSHSQSFYVNNMRIEAKSAEDVYINHIMVNSLLEEEKKFIDELNYIGTVLRKKIEKSKALYECEPDEFMKVAEEFINSNKNQAQIKACKTLIQVHQSRKITDSITPLIIIQLKHDLELTVNHGQDMSYLGNWTRSLIKNQPEQVDNFFEEMCKALAEKLKTMPEKNSNNNQNPLNYVLSSAMEKVFAECINSQFTYTLKLIASLNKHEISQNSILFRNSNLSYSLGNIFRKNDDLYEDLKSTSLFEELENFDAIDLPKSREQSSILREFIYNTRNNSKRKTTYINKLKKEAPQSFGIKYLTVLLENQDPTKIYTFLDHHLDKVKQIPKEHQEQFLRQLAQMMKQYPYKNKITSVTGAFRNFEVNYQSSSSGDKVSQFLKQKLDDDYYNYTEDAALIISTTLKKDLKQARTLWDHSLKQLRKFQLRQGAQFYGGNSMSEQLFNEVRNDDAYSIQKLRFLSSVISTVKFNRRNKYDKQEAIQQLYSQTLRALYDNYRAKSNTKDEANYLAIKDLLDSKDLFKDITLPYANLTGGTLRQASSSELSKLETYLKNHEKRNDFDELILLSSYLAQLKKDSKSQVPNALIQHYLTFLKNDQINISTRFVSLHNIFFNTLNNAPQSPAFNQLFYEVCELASQSKNSEHDYYYEQVLERLFTITDKNELWQAAAKKVLPLIELKLRQDPDAFDSSANSYNEETLTLFDTLFKVGEKDKGKHYLNKASLGLKNRFETIWILILNDQMEAAVSLSQENLANMDLPTNFWHDLQKFKINEKVEKYYTALADQELVYMAKVYYAFASREQKLQLELAKKFEALNIENKQVRKKLIELFSSNNKTKAMVKKFNHELFDSFDPLPIIYSDQHQKNTTYANFLLSSLNKMTDEDLNDVVNKIKKVSMDEDYAYETDNLIEAISRAYAESMKDKSYSPDFTINAKKLLFLGKKLCPIPDNARSIDSLFFSTFILIHNFEGQEASITWLKSFPDGYLKSLRASQLSQCLNILSKLYDEKATEQAKIVLEKKAFYLSTDSQHFNLIFPEEKDRKNAITDISNQISRHVKKLDDLIKYPAQFASLIAKGNNAYKFWQLMEKDYQNNKKIADANPFGLTIQKVHKNVNSFSSLSANRMDNFIRKLDKKKMDSNLAYLASLKEKPDWLQELEVNMIYKKAIDAKAADHPPQFLKFYQDYFANDKTPANERLRAYYNNYSTFRQSPIIIASITPLFAGNTAESHVLNNSFHELLILSMHYNPVGLQEKTLNDLLSLVEKKYDLGSNKARQNNILLRDLKIRLNKDYKNPDNLLSDKETYLSLIHNGKHQEFAELFATNWQKIKLFNNLMNAFLPSKERDEQFLLSVEQLQDPELKMLAKAIYYNESRLIYKDFSFYRFNHTQGSGNRLDQVAAEFSKTEFKNAKLRQSIALLLMLRTKGREVAKNDVITFMKNLKLEEIVPVHQHHYRVAYSLYIQDLLEKKDFSSVNKACKDLNSLARSNKQLKNSAHAYLQEISTMLVKEICSGQLKFTSSEEQQELNQLAQALMNSNDHLYHFTSLIQLMAVRNILKDKASKAEQWIKKMPKKYESRFGEYELYKILKSLPNWSPGIKHENLQTAQIKVLDSPAIQLMFKKRLTEIERVKKRLKLK